MRRHLRKLLVLAVLGTVAPISAVQALAEPIYHDDNCPYARAAAAAAEREAAAGAAVRWSDSADGISVFDGSSGASALAP